MDNNWFKGKVVIVTGAASGIGLAAAEQFLRGGCKVVAVDLKQAELEGAFEASDNLVLLEHDVTAADAADKIASTAEQAFGNIDILVNNAGIAVGATFEETTDDIWTNVMDVNVNAMFRLSRRVIQSMKETGAGRIINIGSIMSDMAGPGLAAYGTSKHAVAGLTKAMAVDLGTHKITVNYVQPGAIVTGLSKPFFEDEEFRTYWENKAPVGRLGQPEDVANAILFLASKEAEFISGTGLNVDGGAIINF